MSRFLGLAFFLSLAFSTNGQVIVAGKVLSRDANEPIAYTNIGILHSNVGTLSNPDGSFSLRIPETHRNDTLIFSALGYGRRLVAVRYFQQKSVNVYLTERSTVLNDVVISAKNQKGKTYELGNARVRGGVLETDTLYAGGSTALLIDGSDTKGFQFPAYLEKVHLRIFKNNLPVCKFRLRVQDVDPSGKPGRDLLEKSIVVESSMRSGWMEFDLSTFYFLVERPLFVTFEQILDVHDRTKIADGYREFMELHPDKIKIDTVEFEGKKEVRKLLKGFAVDLPGTFVGIDPTRHDQYTCYVRETSFGEWTKQRGIISAFVTLSDQPGLAKTEKDNCFSSECLAEKICRDFMNETGTNGLQLCVSERNKIMFSLNMGLADAKKKTPVSRNTQFRINSISKSITAAAVIKLAEAKKLDLDAPIQHYTPSFPVKKYPITTRQLAGHLAGIRDYHETNLSDLIRTEHYQSATDAIELFKDDTLLFEPGKQFHYSTFGWNLIGAVVEGASGQSYLHYLQQAVLAPLAMRNTCADDVTEILPNRSRFYDEAGEESDYGDLSYKYAGGGLLSTAEDLIRFGGELLTGTFLDANSKKTMFTSQRTTDGRETGYGLGWYVGVDSKGRRIWHHSGDMLSSSSHLVIYPDHGLVISFVANSQAGAAFSTEGIADLVLSVR